MLKSAAPRSMMTSVKSLFGFKKWSTIKDHDKVLQFLSYYNWGMTEKNAFAIFNKNGQLSWNGSVGCWLVQPDAYKIHFSNPEGTWTAKLREN